MTRSQTDLEWLSGVSRADVCSRRRSCRRSLPGNARRQSPPPATLRSCAGHGSRGSSNEFEATTCRRRAPRHTSRRHAYQPQGQRCPGHSREPQSVAHRVGWRIYARLLPQTTAHRRSSTPERASERAWNQPPDACTVGLPGPRTVVPAQKVQSTETPRPALPPTHQRQSRTIGADARVYRDHREQGGRSGLSE
jgi:hypothetical protein